MNRGFKKDRPIRRGDIFYADLNPVTGSEQGGTRPVVIIQNNTGNRYSPTVIVAATTGRTNKHPLPTHAQVASCSNRLGQDTIVLLEQIRTIDCSRLGSYVGHLDATAIRSLNEALAVSVGLDNHHNLDRGLAYVTGSDTKRDKIQNDSCLAQ